MMRVTNIIHLKKWTSTADRILIKILTEALSLNLLLKNLTLLRIKMNVRISTLQLHTLVSVILFRTLFSRIWKVLKASWADLSVSFLT